MKSIKEFHEKNNKEAIEFQKGFSIGDKVQEHDGWIGEVIGINNPDEKNLMGFKGTLKIIVVEQGTCRYPKKIGHIIEKAPSTNYKRLTA